MSSGGKRVGCGRKASPEGARVTLNARVLPSTLTALRQMSDTSGLSLGKVLDGLV